MEKGKYQVGDYPKKKQDLNHVWSNKHSCQQNVWRYFKKLQQVFETMIETDIRYATENKRYATENSQ